MNKFSFYRKGITNKTPSLEMAIERAIEIIRSSQYQEEIERLRNATNKHVKDVIKKGLDYFTFSGLFKTRAADKLLMHSLLICLDIDGLDQLELRPLKITISNDPHTLACFVSPSGSGLKVVVKLDPRRFSPDLHLNFFLELENYFREKFDVALDKSGKDVCRACFVSFDPEAYLNLNSETFKLLNHSGIEKKVEVKQEVKSAAAPPVIPMRPTYFPTSAGLDQARYVVRQIQEQKIDITSNYDDWRDIGFALSTFGEDGRALYHAVSEQYPEYDYEFTDKRFNEHLAKSNFTSPAKFFAIAKSHGLKLRALTAPAEPAPIQLENLEIRDAVPGEDEETLIPELKKSWSDFEIETLLSVYTLKKLRWKDKDPRYKKTAAECYNKIAGILKKQNWFNLSSYSYVLNRKVRTYTATEEFPIFLLEAESHKLIYQPLHPDTKSRLLTFGEKREDNIYGLTILDEDYKIRKAEIEAEEAEAAEGADDDGKKKKKDKRRDPRLELAVYVRSIEDYVNLLMLGYTVVWSDKLNCVPTTYQYDQQLKNKVQKLYQVGRTDNLGKKISHSMAMEYLDVYNVELPDHTRDGEQILGVADFLQHFTEYEFKKLLEDSLPYRFWEKNVTQHGINFDIENENLYNFLQKNGFFRMRVGDKKSEWCYVRILGNTVSEIYVEDIKTYLKNFARARRLDKGLRKAMFRSPQLNDASLSNLDETNIDFTDTDKSSQYLFFKNKTLRITADAIEVHNPGDVDRFIWDEEVQPHSFKLLSDPFVISKDELGSYDIEVKDKDCMFLKYLVQTSRVHWRKELENGDKIKAMSQDEANNYKIENHVNIAGDNLTDEEKEEQKRHLVNKIFAIGYLLHRYKDRKKPWFPYAMDDKIPEDGRSHGGSGKSILFDIALRSIQRKNFYINGRNTKLNEDAFKYDGLTEHHRYVLIDDANEFLKLDLFFTDITGDIKVNPKGKKPYVIPFEKGGKFAFTSNFPPKNLDSSILRRILFVVFSDYYHTAGETNDYLETRDPGTDLGITLFAEFNEDQWNHFYNVMAHCLKFYLSTTEKIGPAMDNVTKRNLISQMGLNFLDWALAYFSDEGDKLDAFIIREEAFTDFKFHNPGHWTAQSFLDRLKAFCRYQGYVLNPKDYVNPSSKKIIRKVAPKHYDRLTNTWKEVEGAKKTTKEMIYLQTKDELAKVEDAEAIDDTMPF